MSFVLLSLLACTDPGEGGDTDDGTTWLQPDVQELRFDTSDGLVLEGTLHLPTRSLEQPVPGLVLVHGSGPNSRDETMAGQLNMSFGFELDVFEELAQHLAGQGWAVLRYDKRTCFSGNGCDNDYPTPSSDVLVEDFVDDADAALTALGQVETVDPSRLVVVGHSQGASFVPRLLDARPELAGGVLLAGGYRPIDELLAYQLDFTVALLEELGYSAAEIDSVTADLQEAVTALAELRAGIYAGTEIWGASAAFWSDWMALTDQAPLVAEQVEQPMLALSGDYDWNVPPEETEAWGALFATLSPPHQATVLPCVTHALNCITEPDWQQLVPADIGDQLDGAVLAALDGYLSEL